MKEMRKTNKGEKEKKRKEKKRTLGSFYPFIILRSCFAKLDLTLSILTC
jgi:hypothetical protein